MDKLYIVFLENHLRYDVVHKAYGYKRKYYDDVYTMSYLTCLRLGLAYHPNDSFSDYSDIVISPSSAMNVVPHSRKPVPIGTYMVKRVTPLAIMEALCIFNKYSAFRVVNG